MLDTRKTGEITFDTWAPTTGAVRPPRAIHHPKWSPGVGFGDPRGVGGLYLAKYLIPIPNDISAHISFGALSL